MNEYLKEIFVFLYYSMQVVISYFHDMIIIKNYKSNWTLKI